MINFRKIKLSFLVVASLLTHLALGAGRTYDPGPDPSTPEGQGYLKVFSEYPNAAVLGKTLFPSQRGGKFRYHFGPIFYRGNTAKNSVSVLVIGQDGTHIAEAAGRPFIGGTGGRLEHLLDYLGIENGFFMNTFSYTINGQVSDFAPVIEIGKDGKEAVRWRQFQSPEMFLLGQDPRSPIVESRNAFIEQVIRANPDSLKAIIAVGGAANDTLATFIRSRGGKVDTKVKPEAADKLQMIRYRSAHAGGNRSFFFPVDEKGRNLLLKDGEEANYSSPEFQKTLTDRINRSPKLKAQLIRLKGGEYENGIFDLAQFGYDLDTAEVNGKASLQGLKLSDGSSVTGDIRFISVPHPGAAGAGASTAKLEAGFQRQLDKLSRAVKEGWNFTADGNKPSPFLDGEKFKYGRGDVPLSDSPFGKSELVNRNTSDSSRSGADAIDFGSRQRGDFSKSETEVALKAPLHADFLQAGELPWMFSRNTPEIFDPGPDSKWESLLKALPNDEIFKVKRGKSIKTDGVEALSVGSLPGVGDFGHYRGTFTNPEVLVVADPNGFDDTYTARALSGEHGQKLHGFLSGLGVEENYLVIKTVPYDMNGKSTEDWKRVMKLTDQWRSDLLTEIIKTQNPKLILTSGEWANSAVEGLGLRGIKIVNLDAGFANGFKEIQKSKVLDDGRKLELVESPKRLPRSHLPFGMQSWVGDSGNRVLAPKTIRGGLGGQYRVVVPEWVGATEVEPDGRESKFFEDLRGLDFPLDPKCVKALDAIVGK